MADGTYMDGVVHPNIGKITPAKPFDAHKDANPTPPDGNGPHTCESPTGCTK